jgi:hypothetical protein
MGRGRRWEEGEGGKRTRVGPTLPVMQSKVRSRYGVNRNSCDAFSAVSSVANLEAHGNRSDVAGTEEDEGVWV